MSQKHKAKIRGAMAKKVISYLKLYADDVDLSPYIREMTMDAEYRPREIKFQEDLDLGEWSTHIPGEHVAKLLGHPWADKKIGDRVSFNYEGLRIAAEIEDIYTDDRGCLTFALLFPRPSA